MKTENKMVLLPIVLLMIAAAIMGCKTEPELCALGAHLGINEKCSTTGNDSCGLQDYRTEAQKASFSKAINRYGKESNYTAKQLRDTADNIVKAFNDFRSDGGGSGPAMYDNVMSKISKLCVTLAANSRHTWDGATLGADVSATSNNIQARLEQLYEGQLALAGPAAAILVQQLQIMGIIRLAAGKDSDTEQLPVLAGALLCTRSVLFLKRKTAWRTKK